VTQNDCVRNMEAGAYLPVFPSSAESRTENQAYEWITVKNGEFYMVCVY
jgi:hypothetical protein